MELLAGGALVVLVTAGALAELVDDEDDPQAARPSAGTSAASANSPR